MDTNGFPESISLQLHVTDRCNIACPHCYGEKKTDTEFSFEELSAVLQQYTALLTVPRQNNQPKIDGHIAITGGEPFMRNDIFDILNYLAEQEEMFSFGVLTNGTLIDASAAERLAALKPLFVQVSINGDEGTDERLKGKLEKVVNGIEHLKKAEMYTVISFTARKDNYKRFPEVAQLGRQLNVDMIWSDRFIPLGKSKELTTLLMTPEETRDFFELMNRERETSIASDSPTRIVMNRALQFLVFPPETYRCEAGESEMTIRSNGDVYPCRRLPIKAGNIFEKSLTDIYLESELFKKLRQKDAFDPACQGCAHAHSCCGGLKCLSYAVTGDAFKKDPGCWVNV